MHYRLSFNRLFLALVLLPLLCAATSCIREDLGPCYKDIMVDYKIGDDSLSVEKKKVQEEFKSEVKNLSVFVFDKDGRYVGAWLFSMEEFNKTGKLPIPLEYGTYSMVIWGGVNPNQYNVGAKGTDGKLEPVKEGVTRIEDFQLQVKPDSSKSVTSKVENLYHSISSNVVVQEKKNTVLEMPIKKITSDVVVKLFGLRLNEEAPRTYVSSSDIEVFIKARNGRFNYDNTVSSSADTITYLPFKVMEGGDSLVVEMRTMDISSKATKPQLFVRNKPKNSTMYLYELDKLISQLPPGDKPNSYEIEIFYNTYGCLKIVINGWVVRVYDINI